jgi:hypothetical protein
MDPDEKEVNRRAGPHICAVSPEPTLPTQMKLLHIGTLRGETAREEGAVMSHFEIRFKNSSTKKQRISYRRGTGGVGKCAKARYLYAV